MQAKIYQPAKSAMQSGRAGSGQWRLDYERTGKLGIEPLMGWTSADDTLNQVEINFATLDEAEAFARHKGLDYVVIPANERVMKPQSYLDNFKAPPQAVSTGPKD